MISVKTHPSKQAKPAVVFIWEDNLRLTVTLKNVYREAACSNYLFGKRRARNTIYRVSWEENRFLGAQNKTKEY